MPEMSILCAIVLASPAVMDTLNEGPVNDAYDVPCEQKSQAFKSEAMELVEDFGNHQR
jgi:hypothetical protein